ncbi:MAG: hypothetical protein ACRD8W_30555 [Nitrososphaeraceae archaeon]
MKCDNGTLSMQQVKMIMMIVLVTTLAALLVTMAATQAFAAINLNSSKSNIYRATQNAQSNEGGSVEQTSTNICDCPSNGDQEASGDETQSITVEPTQSISIECSGTDVTCSASQGNTRHDISMNSIRNLK